MASMQDALDALNNLGADVSQLIANGGSGTGTVDFQPIVDAANAIDDQVRGTFGGGTGGGIDPTTGQPFDGTSVGDPTTGQPILASARRATVAGQYAGQQTQAGAPAVRYDPNTGAPIVGVPSNPNARRVTNART